MTLLLDTHVALWLVSDPEQVDPTVRRTIAKAPTVFLSAVVLWEIAIKSGQGKLKVPDDFRDRVLAFAYTALAITAAHAWRVRDLPQRHRDPFDRPLVVQT